MFEYFCDQKKASLTNLRPRKFPRLSQYHNAIPAYEFLGPAHLIGPPMHHLNPRRSQPCNSTQIAEPHATLEISEFSTQEGVRVREPFLGVVFVA